MGPIISKFSKGVLALITAAVVMYWLYIDVLPGLMLQTTENFKKFMVG